MCYLYAIANTRDKVHAFFSFFFETFAFFCFKPKFILCLEDSFLSYSIFFKRLVIGLLFSHVILEIRDRETELGSIFLVYD